MTTLNLFARLKNRFFPRNAPRRPFRRNQSILALELLEKRELLSGTPAPAVSLTHVVDNFYETVLGRAPGPNEEAIWINAMQAGLSPAATVPQFLKSPEYIANQVRDRYSHLLGRTPDPEAAAFWLQTRSAQVSDPAVAGLTDDQMAAALISSPEYYAHNGQTSSSFVTALYGDVLGRAPDADGLSHWVSQLDRATALGAGLLTPPLVRQTIAQDFLNSSEDHAREVDAVYASLLGRAPEDQGFKAWTDALAHGLSSSQLIADVAVSPEFIARMASAASFGPGSLAPIDPTVTGNEGYPISSSLIGSFTETDGNTNPNAYSVSVAWGDGNTSPATVTGGTGGVFYINATHTYSEEGSYSITSTVTDNLDLNVTTVPATASIADGALTVTSSPSWMSTQGFAYSNTVIAFNDADPNRTLSDYSATINWGDGAAVIAGTITSSGSTFVVAGTHAYQEPGTYTISGTITDVGGATVNYTATMTVSSGTNTAPAPLWPPTAIGDLVTTAAGTGASTGPCGCTGPAVRFADGMATFSAPLLSSAGFGTAWDVTATWSNLLYTGGAAVGTAVSIDTLPSLVSLTSGATLVVVSSGAARYFDLVGTSYLPRYDELDTLVQNTTNHEYVLTDTTGAQIRFNDFSGGGPTNANGKFKSYTDPYGNLTSVTSYNAAGQIVEVQRQSTVGATTIVESYLFSYLSSGVNSGLMATATLRRQVNSGSWSTVRSASFSYYDGTQSYGNTGDLQLAQVKDPSANILDTYYFRYYVPTDTGGYTHGLKYFFSADSYARLVAAYPTPTTATDAQVAPYADAYLQYDSTHRITQYVAQGAGASTNNGGTGLGTYTFAYTASTNNVGFNSWAEKTVETMPDSNQKVAYTNAFGQVMLFVMETGGQNWETFHKYDGQGRDVLTASPAALTGWDDTKADLLNSTSGNYQYMSDSAGLVTVTDYYATTTATDTTAGGVAGYVQDHKIQQGETGTPILQDTEQYFAHTVSGFTIAPLATTTVYRNTDGTGGQTTTYAYTWFSGTAQPQSVTTTLPTISAAQNGPASADVEVTFFDTYGRQTWHKNPDGFIDYTAYDQATSAVVKTITDVDTTKTTDFTGLPSGWSTPTGGGLHLIATMAVDALGRDTRDTDPAGNVTYTVYNDTNYEVLVYPGWNSTTNAPTGPTQVIRLDPANSYVETLTMSATPHLTAGLPDGTEAVSGLQSLSRAYTDSAGQVTTADAYFNLTGLTYSTAIGIGALNTNYYRRTIDYDNRGRQNRVLHPTGTIERTVDDALGRVVSTWVGTNDTPTTGYWSPTNNTGSANMVQLTADVYDGGSVGNSNLTQETVYPGGSATNRVSQFFFDWRDRLVATKDGVQGTEDTTTHRPIIYATFDNLDEVTKVQHFDGDGVTITSTGGVPQAPSSSLLREQSGASYDDQGRVYQTQTWSVNQSTGAVSTNALTTNVYFTHRGEVMASSAPGGLWTKNQYDGAGRLTIQYLTDGAAGTTWSQAAGPASDNVLQQAESIYDAADNLIETVTRQRNHDETATGALGNETTSPKARVYYAAAYYDQANRVTGTVDVGTNGGTAWTRPSTLPTPSDTALVVSRTYSPAGDVATVTDPRGIQAQTTYDALGRTIQTIADYTNGTPTNNTNATTQYTYDGDNHVLTVTALMTGSAYQTTQFVYGVTTAAGSDLNSNDILAKENHPDKSTGAPSSTEQDVFTVNALGETKSATDRNGNVHTYSYDVLGRVTSDAVTTLGTGVDSSVRRLETAYNSAGLPYLFTSYDASSGGSVVNQVEDLFNGLGQLTQEYQSHSGVVNTSTTPSMQYAYTEMASGVNNSRPTSITYPNGRVINYNYTTGLDSNISRLSSISDSSATLETYTYLGLDTVVKRGHPQPGVDLTYIKQSGESNGDAGDQYIGLDRFGRVIDQRWIVSSTGVATDRFQYGYDRNGNPLYRNSLVNTAFGELYHATGAGNGYDSLNQIQAFARGVLSASGSVLDTISSPSHSQSWAQDALGNFSSVTTDGTQVTRTNNQQNEVTAVGASTLAFDKNGNLTTDDQGHTLIFDAWNRLVQVKNGSTILTSYGYDALGRRVTENPGTQRDLYYSAAWQVLEERVAGAAQIQYVWSPVYVDALIERDRDPTGGGTLSERLYVQQDANWNVTAVINTSGTVVERYIYDPFGVQTVLSPTWSTLSGSTVAWAYGFQGYRQDAIVGLDDARNRVYSPSLGRFVQPDPTQFSAGDNNFYRMEANGPTNGTDPSGLVFNPIDPPKKGQPVPQFDCPNTTDPKIFKVTRTTPIRTITDRKGNKLIIYCDGTSFYGEIVLADGNKKVIPFGKCLPEGGINNWSIEFNKDGSFKLINWYNVGPIVRINDMKTSLYLKAIKESIAGAIKELAKNSTIAQDQVAFMKALLIQLSNLEQLKTTDDYIIFKTVMYRWPEMKVYRLYWNKTTMKFEWKLDNDTPIGVERAK